MLVCTTFKREMNGIRANDVVLDERNLTRRVTKSDVQTTLEQFRSRASNDIGDVEFVVSTPEETEQRAKYLLDLGEAALKRLFGSDAKIDVSVVTSQPRPFAQLRLGENALEWVSRAIGVANIDTQKLENFVAKRVSTEFQLMLYTFDNTDLLNDPTLSIKLWPSGRTLTVSRAQRFR
jgi:hypothetical protein